jgi:chaperone modulatory protein CbpM
MITIQTVCASVPGLSEARLRQFLEQDWVRPDQSGAEPIFHDIDVARVRLIVELNTELEVEEPTLPLVLSLLDQLYATRRQLRLVLDSLDGDARDGVVARLTRTPD